MQIDLNQQNLEACLKEVNNIGGTIYQNICTGQSNYVPWGTGDWLFILGALFFMISTVIFITIMIYK